MPITQTNAKGENSYLHQGTTTTGKPKYSFSMESNGVLAESIPARFEIYENPNALVFLRPIPPKIIPDEERQAVEDGMRKYAVGGAEQVSRGQRLQGRCPHGKSG